MSCNFYNPILESVWDNREPTDDEKRILAFLKQYDIMPDKLLHIGIGNNLFYGHYQNTAVKITGVTLSWKEYEKALGFKDPNYQVLLYDKYNPNLENMLSQFNYIIDNNICSYRCCDNHAISFFKILIQKLAPHGILLSDAAGFQYGFQGKAAMDIEVLCNQAGCTYSVMPNGVIIFEKK